MFVKSILRATWHNNSFLIRLIVIICLITVTILDSIGIITTYVYDNRLTVVRTEKGNDSSAFLENITIRYMGSDSALPKSWLEELNISFFGQSEFYSNIMQEVLNGEMSFNARNKSSVEAKAYAISFFGILTQLDWQHGILCVFYGQDLCGRFFGNNSGNYSRILRDANPKELVMLEEEALSDYLDAFLIDYDWPIPWKSSNHSNLITIQKIGDDEMEIEISPGDYPIKDTTVPLEMKLRLNEQRPTPESRTPSVFIFVGRSSQTVEFQRNMSHKIWIDVKNLGIYDKSRTSTKCTWDPEISFGVYRSYCDERGILKAIVERCGCIPFSAKKDVRKLTLSDSVTKPIPFCDFQHYYACAEIGVMELNPEEDCLPSCITIRNQYAFTVEKKPCEEGTDECSFVSFTVTTYDQSYVVFEDRYQTTFPQFVSQLGGDIGLYLGLSLLSVCQLVAFVQTQYRKYKCMQMDPNGKKGQFTRKQFLLMLFKGIKESIGSVGEDAEKSIKTGTRKEDDEDARWKARENATLRKFTAIEQKLEHKMELLTKLVETVESRLNDREKSPKRLKKVGR